MAKRAEPAPCGPRGRGAHSCEEHGAHAALNTAAAMAVTVASAAWDSCPRPLPLWLLCAAVVTSAASVATLCSPRRWRFLIIAVSSTIGVLWTVVGFAWLGQQAALSMAGRGGGLAAAFVVPLTAAAMAACLLLFGAVVGTFATQVAQRGPLGDDGSLYRLPGWRQGELPRHSAESALSMAQELQQLRRRHDTLRALLRECQLPAYEAGGGLQRAGPGSPAGSFSAGAVSSAPLVAPQSRRCSGSTAATADPDALSLSFCSRDSGERLVPRRRSAARAPQQEAPPEAGQQPAEGVVTYCIDEIMRPRRPQRAHHAQPRRDPRRPRPKPVRDSAAPAPDSRGAESAAAAADGPAAATATCRGECSVPLRGILRRSSAADGHPGPPPAPEGDPAAGAFDARDPDQRTLFAGAGDVRGDPAALARRGRPLARCDPAHHCWGQPARGDSQDCGCLPDRGPADGGDCL